MEQFNELLLRTAFACMACDGDIAEEEVDLIKSLNDNDHMFGDIDIDHELNALLIEINEFGAGFLKSFLDLVNESQLNEEDSIKLLDVAVKTIKADNIIKYSEIKFFKVIKANLNISDEKILEKVEGVDEMWVAQDIKDYGLLYDSYFDNIEIPKFKIDALSSDEEQTSSLLHHNDE